MSRVEPQVFRAGDEQVLRAWTRASWSAGGLAQRARIVLLAWQGRSNAEVGRSVGVSLPTVHSWRFRCATGGLAALDDHPRSGRPAVHDEQAVIAATLGAAAGRAGGAALVDSAAGRSARGQLLDGGPDLAAMGLEPWKDENGPHRSGARGQDP